jgi:hypothetical protein
MTTRVIDGRKVVATAGTREQLAPGGTQVESVCITALETNANKVVVGGSTVVAALGTRRGTPLAASESVTFYVNDLSAVWVDAMTNGEGVIYSAEVR